MKPVLLAVSLLGVAALLAAPASPAAAQAPAAEPGRPKPLLEEWHAVFLAGRKAGHAHLVFFEEAPPAGSRVRFERTVEIRFGRVPAARAFRSAYRGLEDVGSGALLSFSFELSDGDRTASCTGFAEGNDLCIAGPGGERRLPGGAPGPYAYLERAREGARKGGSFAVGDFDPVLGAVVEWTWTLEGKETLSGAVGPEEVSRFAVRSPACPGAVLEWRDREGAVVKTHRAAGDLATWKADADFALREAEMTPFAVPFEPGEDDGNGRVFLMVEQNCFLKGLYGPGQTVERGPLVQDLGHTWRVRVKREPLRGPGPGRPVRGGPDEAPFTGSDAWVDWVNAAVQRRVAEVFSNEPTAPGAAAAASRWVGANVRELPGGPFQAAPEVVDAARSNSFGLAALLAALCRGGGVPARIVAGVRRNGAELEGRFWVEACVGSWVALDSSVPGGFAGDDSLRLRVLDTRREDPEVFWFRFTQDVRSSRFR
jgi:hypothetical protein